MGNQVAEISLPTLNPSAVLARSKERDGTLAPHREDSSPVGSGYGELTAMSTGRFVVGVIGIFRQLPRKHSPVAVVVIGQWDGGMRPSMTSGRAHIDR